MKRTLSTLCVAALLVVAGCSGLVNDSAGEDENSDLSEAKQIQQAVLEAMANVDTYRMEMVMNISAKGQTITMTQRGVFDREAKKARIETSFLGIRTTTYIDGTTMYVKMRGHWRTQNISQKNPWKQGTGLARQKELLASANVSVVGSATVDGIATTVLVVEPSEEELKQLISQRQSRAYRGVAIENVTYKMYIAKETHRLRKMEMTMTMTSSGQTMKIEMTMTYSAYNEPVDITIPEAATTSSADAASADSASASRATRTERKGVSPRRRFSRT